MKLRKRIVIGASIISMLSILLFISKNNILYNKVEENTINEIESGIAVYVANDTDYERVDTIPESGYTFNESLSYCNESEVKNENIKISYDMNTKMISITPVANEKTKCYLYFDQDTAIARDYILAQNTVNEGTPDFSTTATTNEGIYTAEDDDGTSYYWRGAVNNNYFYFGGYYWRIIRINGDGTLRLIYQGKSTSSTGTNSQIGTSAFNSSIDDNAYDGYMFGTTGANTYSATHTNTNSSTIKVLLDNWYDNNLINYEEYIANTSNYCGDRTPSTSSSTINNLGGYGTELTYYATRYRIYTNKTPSLKCSNVNDFYTLNNSTKGNQSLDKAIGLITADEVSFAGGVVGTTNSNYYLYSGQNYWTISPGTYSNSNASGYVYSVLSSGSIAGNKLNENYGIRPVININKNVELEGNGTSNEPYRIKGTEITPTASEIILANITPKTTTPDFSTVATTDEGVYAVSDGMYGGTSYYWRGAVTNNYVTFAGFCWRIIRINGDGSIRLIYDGTTCHANGTSTKENIAVTSQAYNSSYNNSAYVGWSYTASSQHGTGTKSNARSQVETWYNTNLASYDSYIATGKFCNDREVGSGTWSATGSTFYYAAYTRLYTNKTPNLSCINTSDVFTVKVGLITADEVSFVGGVWNATNTSYYLFNNNSYWTMTPDFWYYGGSSSSGASVFNVDSKGGLLDFSNVTQTYGLRPVINLNADVSFSSGTGTQADPYVVAS